MTTLAVIALGLILAVGGTAGFVIYTLDRMGGHMPSARARARRYRHLKADIRAALERGRR